jgi:hypothetical protein
LPEFQLEDVDNTGHCQFDAIAHQVWSLWFSLVFRI